MDFNKELVCELITENLDKAIEIEIHDNVENLGYWDGYVSGFDIEILDYSEVEFETLSDSALVQVKFL